MHPLDASFKFLEILEINVDQSIIFKLLVSLKNENRVLLRADYIDNFDVLIV